MPKSLTFEIMFLDLGTDMQFSIVVKHQTKNSVEEGGGGFELVHRTWGGSGGDGRDITYKMTFLGYDGAVQYAMVRPPFPAPTEPRPADDKFAVLIALHGYYWEINFGGISQLIFFCVF